LSQTGKWGCMFWAFISKLVFGNIKSRRSFKKGKQFEQLAEKFFPASTFDLIHRTADYRDNCRRFVESSLKPDFMFRDKLSGKCFYVECKFRSSMIQDRIECCTSSQQLARYYHYNKRISVFLLIGLGGKPSRPCYIFLIPLREITELRLTPSFINKFRISTRPPVKAAQIWKNLNFSTIGYK